MQKNNFDAFLFTKCLYTNEKQPLLKTQKFTKNVIFRYYISISWGAHFSKFWPPPRNAYIVTPNDRKFIFGTIFINKMHFSLVYKHI